MEGRDIFDTFINYFLYCFMLHCVLQIDIVGKFYIAAHWMQLT